MITNYLQPADWATHSSCAVINHVLNNYLTEFILKQELVSAQEYTE